jgi:hypothetical protein
MLNYRGAIIATPGPMNTRHEGIFIGSDLCQRHWVIENSKIKGEVSISALEEFSGSGQWEIVQTAPEGYEDEVINRAYALLGKPYDLTGYNCQHFVAEVYEGEPSSWQLKEFGAGLGLIAIMIAAARKAKGN